MLRLVSLDYGFSRPFRPACPADSLGNQLKRLLGGAVIGFVQREIGKEHPDQSHPREIMPFHDHLRSDQNIRLSVGEGLQYTAVAVLAAGCVGVHAQYPYFRKFRSDDLLHLLCPDRHASDRG